MLARVRRHLTYANVMATVAVLMAVSGMTAATAAAHHVPFQTQAEVTWAPGTLPTCTIKLQNAGEECLRRGSRAITVSWQVTCPTATSQIAGGLALSRLRPDPGARPTTWFGIDTDPITASSGSVTVSAPAGSRSVPRLTVDCFDTLPVDPADPDAREVAHESTAVAYGPLVEVAPRVLGYRWAAYASCDLPRRLDLRVIQVGMQPTMVLDAAFDRASLLGRRGMKAVRIRIKGAGRNARLRGRVSRGGSLAFRIPPPKRTGVMRIWAEFDGVPAKKVIRMRVLRRPRGC